MTSTSTGHPSGNAIPRLPTGRGTPTSWKTRLPGTRWLRSRRSAALGAESTERRHHSCALDLVEVGDRCDGATAFSAHWRALSRHLRGHVGADDSYRKRRFRRAALDQRCEIHLPLVTAGRRRSQRRERPEGRCRIRRPLPDARQRTLEAGDDVLGVRPGRSGSTPAVKPQLFKICRVACTSTGQQHPHGHRGDWHPAMAAAIVVSTCRTTAPPAPGRPGRRISAAAATADRPGTGH